MNYIYITLQRGAESDDLKIPGFVPVGELIGVFRDIYGIEAKALHAEPKGMILDVNKTLDEQGVLYGSKLTIV